MIMNDWYDIGLFQQHVSSYEDVKVYFHADGQYLDFSGRMGYFQRSLGPTTIEGGVQYYTEKVLHLYQLACQKCHFN